MDYSTSAAYLYAGGWRSADRDQMKREYDLTDEEAKLLSDALADIEEDDK